MIKSLIDKLQDRILVDPSAHKKMAISYVSNTIEQLTKVAIHTGRLNSTKVDDALQVAVESLENLEEVILNEVV